MGRVSRLVSAALYCSLCERFALARFLFLESGHSSSLFLHNRFVCAGLVHRDGAIHLRLGGRKWFLLWEQFGVRPTGSCLHPRYGWAWLHLQTDALWFSGIRLRLLRYGLAARSHLGTDPCRASFRARRRPGLRLLAVDHVAMYERKPTFRKSGFRLRIHAVFTGRS